MDVRLASSLVMRTLSTRSSVFQAVNLQAQAKIERYGYGEEANAYKPSRTLQYQYGAWQHAPKTGILSAEPATGECESSAEPKTDKQSLRLYKHSKTT